MARLFIAINFTDKVKNKVKDIIEKLREFTAKGHFTDEAHMHLTLEFLGEINNKELKSIKDIMDKLEFNPFTLHVDRIGYFKGRDGKTYWLGIERNSTLFNVQEELHRMLLSGGFKLENREYKPHITLGRQIELSSGCNFEEINNNVDLSRNIRDIEISSDKIDLMKSERINGKLIHNVIHSVSASIK